MRVSPVAAPKYTRRSFPSIYQKPRDTVNNFNPRSKPVSRSSRDAKTKTKNQQSDKRSNKFPKAKIGHNPQFAIILK
jgi:hypothetical protein